MFHFKDYGYIYKSSYLGCGKTIDFEFPVLKRERALHVSTLALAYTSFCSPLIFLLSSPFSLSVALQRANFVVYFVIGNFMP